MRARAGIASFLPVLAPGAIVLMAAGACGRGAQGAAPEAAGGGRGAAVVVRTAPVVEKSMAVKVRGVGNVEASASVEIRSQITGELRSVEFSEGQDVAAGRLLFTIDPRPFEAALRQAEAVLARDTAQAHSLETQRARLENLLKNGLVSRADYDALVSNSAAMQASLSADSAAVDNARLQLQHTRIAAPVAGRTGALLVHRGSLVRANDALPLVVINQMTPAFVSFAVPARLLPRVRPQSGRGRLTVEAAPAGASDQASSGTVTFVDNAVDPATDSIRLKATFPNLDRRLWPGAFVDVTLQLSVDARAIVVPSSAVQPSQQGTFVYVVKADQTVDARPVKVAWTEAAETVIEEGLRPGELVVTDGQLRLTPGARVSAKAADAAGKGS